MRILGIDPGGKTGWAVYDTRARAVVQAGICEGADLPWGEIVQCDRAVIERPEAYGAARPQVVDCAWVAGRLYEAAHAHCETVGHLYRREVVKLIGLALGVPVRGDAEVWRALCELHGGDGADVRGRPATKKTPAREQGPLGGCIAHAKAAVAVAYAAAQGSP